jgi:glyoxylate reductase
MTPNVFVVQPIPQVAIDRLREVASVEVFPYSHRPITAAELESASRRSDYILAMHETPITASVLTANPDLRGVGLGSAHAEFVDVEAARAAGVKLLESARAADPERSLNGQATADLMVGMVLCLAYRIVEADRYSRAKGYFQEMTMDLMGLGCTGKTVSLIGLGRVARFAVPRLRALGLTVLYTKRSRLGAQDEAALGIEWVDTKEELIERGDFVCMCANLEDANVRLMTAEDFGRMKPTAFFVNIGRGRLVDEPALIEALTEGRIAGAGLDVFWEEPPVVDEPHIPLVLRQMENVVLTPHNGGATWDSRSRQTLGIAEAIAADILASAPAATAQMGVASDG